MISPNIEKAVKHLQNAIALLKGTKVKPKRNPEWFRETGHLSDKGIEQLHSLFQRDVTSYRAAKAMGMSYRATRMRHEDWRKKHTKRS